MDGAVTDVWEIATRRKLSPVGVSRSGFCPNHFTGIGDMQLLPSLIVHRTTRLGLALALPIEICPVERNRT